MFNWDNKYTIILLYPMYIITEINIHNNIFSLFCVFFILKNEHMKSIKDNINKTDIVKPF